MLENKKDILLSIYNIDVLENKFHNKVKFMNFAHLISTLDVYSDDQLAKISEKLKAVETELQNVSKVVEALEKPGLELIESYDRTKE